MNIFKLLFIKLIFIKNIIFLSKNSLLFLNDLINNMILQNNRATQDPVFVIQDDIWIRWTEDDYDEKIRIDDDYLSKSDLCNDCVKKYENDEEIPDECDYCDDDCFEFIKYDKVISDKGWMFLTELACEQFIKNNRYHFNNPKSYVIPLWRNYELTNIINILFKLTWRKKPNHYS